MFSVAVWGTVGQWVSASLTGGGVLIASLVYWRDSNLSRAAQAKSVYVGATMKDPLDDDPLAGRSGRWRDNRLVVTVQNFSEGNIFRVSVSSERKPLKDFVEQHVRSFSDRRHHLGDSADAFETVIEEFQSIVGRRGIVNGADADVVPKEQSVTFTLEDVDRRTQQIVVRFSDMKGRHWEIALDDDFKPAKPVLQKDWARRYRQLPWKRRVSPQRIWRTSRVRFLVWRRLRHGSERAQQREWKRRKRAQGGKLRRG